MEGVSTLTVNLSQVFARETSRKILLIDANLRHPSLAKQFKLEGFKGLTDVIVDGTDINTLVRETGIDNLYFLPQGSHAAHPLDILNSEKLHECIQNIENEYHYVFIDSAPVIPYADSLFLSANVDLVLLILEADKTRWEVAREALKKLSDVGVNVFGTILNKKKFRIPSFIYKRL